MTCWKCSRTDANHPIEGVARASGGAGSPERPLTLQLRLTDPAYTERLAAFLRSVGQQPVVSGPGSLEVDAPEEELEVYLRVWRVLHPAGDVTFQ